MNARAPVLCPTLPGHSSTLVSDWLRTLRLCNICNGSLHNFLNYPWICAGVLALRRWRRLLTSASSVAPPVPPVPASAAPVAASGHAPLSAASGQLSLSLAPVPGSLLSAGPSGVLRGPSLPDFLRPPGPSVAIPPYLNDGSVTLNFDWVRQHLPLVIDVLVNHHSLALWPDICAELSA
jgi:hypothetical protein